MLRTIGIMYVQVDEQSFPISATIKPSAHGSNDAIDFAANKDTPSEAEGVTTLSLPRSVIKGVAGECSLLIVVQYWTVFTSDYKVQSPKIVFSFLTVIWRSPLSNNLTIENRA